MTKPLMFESMLNVAKCYVSDLTGCILPVGLLYCGCPSQITNVIAMQPPFVMDKWIVGVQQNQRVDYTVNYEVISAAHKTMQIYPSAI